MTGRVCQGQPGLNSLVNEVIDHLICGMEGLWVHVDSRLGS
jgi:hypothetical protein